MASSSCRCTDVERPPYLFRTGCRLEDTLQSAKKSLRFHAMRGTMSVGRSRGGLPPDSLVEDEAGILKDTQRVVEATTIPRASPMLRIGVARARRLGQQGPHAGSPRASPALGVSLHTHLARTTTMSPTAASSSATPAQYGRGARMGRPGRVARALREAGRRRNRAFRRTGTGVAPLPVLRTCARFGHCPSPDAWFARGVRVGLGVAGSASNDAGQHDRRARQAMLLPGGSDLGPSP